MELGLLALCKRVRLVGLFAVLIFLVAGYIGEVCYAERSFPAYFIFGDSLVDVGNNNYITTLAKANKLPFGIDFPGGPTGRFCNGKTVIDVLCEILSLPFPPPYLAPTTRGAAILQGVNYASAGGGIVRRTGYDVIGRVDTDTQIEWFGNTIKKLQEQLGESGTQDLLAKSFYSFAIGANDYINNYLLPGSPTPAQYTPAQFQELLLNKFEEQLRVLYNMGARSILIFSIGPIGCIPSQLAYQSKNGECSKFINNLALNFNAGLKALLNQLNEELSSSLYIYGESFDPVFAFRNNPQQYGFKFGAKACCGAGRFNGNVACLPILKPCPDREDYVFWDSFHPTEAVNRLLGNLVYNNFKDLFPDN